MKEPIRIYCCRKGCANSVETEWPADFAPPPWILTWHGEHRPFDFAGRPSLLRGAFCSWKCLIDYATSARETESGRSPLDARSDTRDSPESDVGHPKVWDAGHPPERTRQGFGSASEKNLTNK